MPPSLCLLSSFLPQSLRGLSPPMTNELITLVKGSSLLSAISIFELTRSTQVIIAQKFTPFELYALLAVFYLLIISPLSRLSERSEEHTSELQSRQYLVCRLLLEKKKKNQHSYT